MKRWMKIALGVMAHWFFLYLPVFFLALFGMIATTATAQGHGNEPPGPLFIVGIVALFGVHFLSILLMLGTQGLFIAHAVKHPRFEAGNLRVVWVLLLVFFGILAAPVYYWMYLFPQPVGAPFFGNKVSA